MVAISRSFPQFTYDYRSFPLIPAHFRLFRRVATHFRSLPPIAAMCQSFPLFAIKSRRCGEGAIVTTGQVSHSERELENSETRANGARVDSEDDEVRHSYIGIEPREAS